MFHQHRPQLVHGRMRGFAVFHQHRPQLVHGRMRGFAVAHLQAQKTHQRTPIIAFEVARELRQRGRRHGAGPIRRLREFRRRTDEHQTRNGLWTVTRRRQRHERTQRPTDPDRRFG